MLSLSDDPHLRKSICRKIASGMEGARSDDTATMKQHILGWVIEDPKTPLNPAIAPGTSKATRGSAHPTFARLLCPLEYDNTPSTYIDIDSGAKDINARQLPRFLFPFNQVNDESALDTVLTGPIMLRASKAVFMGPSSALQGDGYHRRKPPNPVNIGMKKFMPRIIAYTPLQVRFNLSSMQEWDKVGHFDYEEFFWMIVELFDDPEHAAKILTLYNRASPTCLPPTSDLGAIVFKGLYSPVRNLPTDHALYQNCTVTVPPVFAKGFGQFSVAHFDVIAPGSANLDIANITLMLE
ncbi:hypothetical protein B0H10DRAFT_2440661 [Mycena sp. CBHHK59/15]|nr:hypothetical protein B0H10DRAFT_2440661 [Mycena sp. CBHHK59/15]